MEINHNEWYFCDIKYLSNYYDQHQTWWEKIIEIIENRKEKNIYLENLHEHHVNKDEYYHLPIIDKLLEVKSKKLHIALSGNDKNPHVQQLYHNLKNIEVFIIPTFHIHFLSKSKYHSKDIAKKEIEIRNNENFETLFISLNNRYKYHKFKLVDSLFKHSLEKYGTFTYHDEATNKWKQNIKKIDNGWVESGLSNLSNYRKPLIDLVSESEHDYLRITEKTWKPLLLGQLFLVNGGQFFHENLVEMGFKLYNKIFDYSFDKEVNLDDRINGIIKNLIRIKERNYKELFETEKENIIYNQKRCHQIVNNYEYLPQKYLDIIRYLDYITYKGDNDYNIFSVKRIFNIMDENVLNKKLI